MITVKGKANADWAIVSHIIDLGAPNVEFENITFDCKTIKDASGHIFVRQKAGEWRRFYPFKTTHGQEEFVDKRFPRFKCSICNTQRIFGDLHFWAYCPYCGAKMERGDL